MLEDTIERIYHGTTYADEHVGIFLIRGENVVLLGEIVVVILSFPLLISDSFAIQDLDQEDELPLKQVSYQALKPLFLQESAEKRRRDHAKAQVLFDQKGFCREGGEGDGY